MRAFPATHSPAEQQPVHVDELQGRSQAAKNISAKHIRSHRISRRLWHRAGVPSRAAMYCPDMSRAGLLLFLLGVAGCRCGGESVTTRYGELVFVVPDGAGEKLLSEATVATPPVFMGTEETTDVPVRNIGLESVTIASVTRDDGDESLSLDGAVGLEIAGNADAVLPLMFIAPQAADASLTEVAHTASFTLTLTGTSAANETIHLVVTATAAARDCYVPPLVDFGAVPLNHAVIKRVTLSNGAPISATTTAGALTGDTVFTLEGSSSFEVPANGSAELPLRFSPLDTRDYEATFTLKRGALCPEGTVTVRGRGDDTALAWTPERLDFGRVPLDDSASREVTLTNRSNVDLTLGTQLASANFVVDDAPAVLPANGSAKVTVSCRPTALGPLTGILTIDIGTTPITPARIGLDCIGGGPRIRADPNPFQFGGVPYNPSGTAVTRRRLIVQNVGTAPPAPGDVTNNLFLGRNGTLPWFAIVPTNSYTRASEFSVGLISTYDAAKGVPALVGQNLLEFEVTLAPTSPQERRADLLIYSNDSKEPVLRIQLSASPRLPESCSITVSPEGANFGAAPRGATLTRTLVVTNTSTMVGNQCLISGIEMAPGSNLAFRVSRPANAAFLIPAGGSQAIEVTSTVPSDSVIGSYLRGSLRFSVSNTGATREYPVDLQVSRCLLVDPPVLDFGVVQQNCTSAGKAVTIYNTCGVPIVVAESTPPAPYRFTSSPFTNGAITLDPAESATMLIAASPTTTGSFPNAMVFDTVQSGEAVQEGVALRVVSDPVGFQSDRFMQSTSEVDILFVIDDSCSMADEQQALASNFMSFISGATQGGGDWRIGVTTTDLFAQQGVLRSGGSGFPTVLTPSTPNVAAAFAANVSVGVSGSGYEQPFAAMQAAVSEPNRSGLNANFLRTDAALAVVIVTDAVEQSQGTVSQYVSMLRSLKSNLPELVNVSVVGPFTAPSAGCSVEGVDNGRYDAIVTATNGARANICTTNWSQDLTALSNSVFSARRSFTLTGTPRSRADVTVTVNGTAITSGWTLDAVNNAIVFANPPPAGADIVIGYRTACF
ncbi:MAG: choice-of-anchor D domain-containing protein [Archangium sp.]